MSDAELLIEEIKTLPANRVAEVLDFVEFMKQKASREHNAAFTEKLQQSVRDIDEGRGIVKTMVELEALENA